eukprot:PLAT3821.3.p1 GENE.PLAT3821.3~~PLAT3821.3.p1  ORF type:complete len:1960 (+),score=909.62 PLAT3821.3:67-5946(+)
MIHHGFTAQRRGAAERRRRMARERQAARRPGRARAEAATPARDALRRRRIDIGEAAAEELRVSVDDELHAAARISRQMHRQLHKRVHGDADEGAEHKSDGGTPPPRLASVHAGSTLSDPGAYYRSSSAGVAASGGSPWGHSTLRSMGVDAADTVISRSRMLSSLETGRYASLTDRMVDASAFFDGNGGSMRGDMTGGSGGGAVSGSSGAVSGGGGGGGRGSISSEEGRRRSSGGSSEPTVAREAPRDMRGWLAHWQARSLPGQVTGDDEGGSGVDSGDATAVGGAFIGDSTYAAGGGGGGEGGGGSRHSSSASSSPAAELARQATRAAASGAGSPVGLHGSSGDGSAPPSPTHSIPSVDKSLPLPRRLLAKAKRTVRVLPSRLRKSSAGFSSMRRPARKFRLHQKWMIHPERPGKQAWDLFVLLLILYSVLIVPYQIGFDITDARLFWIDRAVELFFMVDIGVTFCTAFWQDSALETRRDVVAKRYLKTWFPIDFASTVPVDLIADIIAGRTIADVIAGRTTAALSSLRLLRAFRLIRLFRLVRLLKLKRVLGMVESSVSINPGVMRLFRLLFALLFITHLLACFWHYIAVTEQAAAGELDSSTLAPQMVSWMIAYGIHDAPVSSRYIASIYWTMATITGVGYGDVAAETTLERGYSIFTQIIGATSFGFFIGNISSLLETMDGRAAAYKRKMRELKEYMAHRQLPRSLRQRIRKFFEYSLARKSIFDEQSILGELSSNLRKQIVLQSNRELIKSVAFFAGRSSDFVAAFVTRMKPFFQVDGEVLARPCELGLEMYFVVSGTVQVFIYGDDRTSLSTSPGNSSATLGSVVEGGPRAPPAAAAPPARRGAGGGEGEGERGEGEREGGEAGAAAGAAAAHRAADGATDRLPRFPSSRRSSARRSPPTLPAPVVLPLVTRSSSTLAAAGEAGEDSASDSEGDLSIRRPSAGGRASEAGSSDTPSPGPSKGEGGHRRRSSLSSRASSSSSALPSRKEVMVGVYSDGAHFGEVSVLLSVARPYGYRCASACDMLSMSKEELDTVLYYFPHLRDWMLVVAERRHRLLRYARQSLIFDEALMEPARPDSSKIMLSESRTERLLSRERRASERRLLSHSPDAPLPLGLVTPGGDEPSSASRSASFVAHRSPTLASVSFRSLRNVSPHGHDDDDDDDGDDGGGDDARAGGRSSDVDAIAAAAAASVEAAAAAAAAAGSVGDGDADAEAADAEAAAAAASITAATASDVPSERPTSTPISMAGLLPMPAALASLAEGEESMDGHEPELAAAAASLQADASTSGGSGHLRLPDGAIGAAGRERSASDASDMESELGDLPAEVCERMIVIDNELRSFASYEAEQHAADCDGSHHGSAREGGDEDDAGISARHMAAAGSIRGSAAGSRARAAGSSAVAQSQAASLLDGKVPFWAVGNRKQWWKSVIHPSSRVKLRWDFVMVVLVLYTVLVVPFRIGFGVLALGYTFAVDRFVDLAFLADMVANFHTAFFDEVGQLVVSLPVIRRRYLRSWFTADLLSTVPFDLIVDLAVGSGSEGLRSLKLFRSIRMVRLFRLARLVKLSKLWGDFENKLSVSPAVLRLLKLGFQVFFITHLISCAWVFVAADSEASGPSWWLAASLDRSNRIDMYVASFYWSFTTMTTVGYGDILPQTDAERLYSCLAMLLGASVFGYVVGSMASLVGKLDAGETRHKEKMDEVKLYMRERRLARPLQKKVEHYYESYLAVRSVFDEAEILRELPDQLRADVVMFLNRRIVAKIPFFRNQDSTFITYVVSMMKPEFFVRGDYVFQAGDIGNEMYFVVRGSVAILHPAAGGSERVVKTLGEGSYFGEVAVLFTSRRTASVRAITNCDAFVLSKFDMERISLDYPALAVQMQEAIAAQVYELQDTHFAPRAARLRSTVLAAVRRASASHEEEPRGVAADAAAGGAGERAKLAREMTDDELVASELEAAEVSEM